MTLKCMANTNEIYLTEDGLNEIKRELDYLKQNHIWEYKIS